MEAKVSDETTKGREERDELSRLMGAYQGGEVDAFTELYRSLSAPITRYLTTIVRDWTTAEELMQETFLQVHRARQTYMPDRPVKPWIYAIARNVALMWLRKMKRRKKFEVTMDEDPPELPVLAEALGTADRMLARRALESLRPDQREVVMLHHFMGFSFKEIAGVLGISTTAAKVRSHRAIKSLRESVTELGGTT